MVILFSQVCSFYYMQLHIKMVLALEAVQEKGKVHGWLGKDVEFAHSLLMKAILNPGGDVLNQWVNICCIPQHLLQLGIPHPEYGKHEFPGVFRYENRRLLAGDRRIFQQYINDTNNTPKAALQKWAESTILYQYLGDKLKYSLVTCLAIQLTENDPEDLSYFV